MGDAGRVLAVDWGQKRFGIALSDPLRMIAQPLTTLTRRPGQRPPVRAVLDLVAAHEVTRIVVGLPLTPEGHEEASATEARAFGERLAAVGHIPVTFEDERLSTVHALKSARRAGVKDRDSRERIDQMAAVAILQGWLDRSRGTGASGDRDTAGDAT